MPRKKTDPASRPDGQVEGDVSLSAVVRTTEKVQQRQTQQEKTFQKRVVDPNSVSCGRVESFYTFMAPGWDPSIMHIINCHVLCCISD